MFPCLWPPQIQRGVKVLCGLSADSATIRHNHKQIVHFKLALACSMKLTVRFWLTAGVSVLAQHPAVEGAGVDAQLLGHEEAETSGVQVCAAADDAVFGQTAQFPGHVGQHVHCTQHTRERQLLRKSKETLQKNSMTQKDFSISYLWPDLLSFEPKNTKQNLFKPVSLVTCSTWT